MQFEKKHVQPWEDYVTAKIVIQSNVAPTYNDDGGAVRRRMVAFGFENSFSKSNVTDIPKTILQADSDALGTITALEWMRARCMNGRWEAESRALEVGKKEVTEKLNKIE